MSRSLATGVTERPQFAVDELAPPEAAAEILAFLQAQGVDTSQADGRSLSDADDLAELATFCLHEVRQMHNELCRDRWGFTEFFSDNVYNAYVSLFKHVHGEATGQNTTSLALGNRFGERGFVNRTIFPDGNGGWVIDDYGMPGRFVVLSDDGERPSTARVLRMVDACSRVLVGPAKRGGPERDLTLRLEHQAGSQLKADSSGVSVIVGRSQLDRSRDEQEAIFAKGHELLDAIASPHLRQPPVCGPFAQTTSRVLVASIAIAKEGRGRDYFHNKFTFRIEACAEALARQGHDVEFVSIEAESELPAVIARHENARPEIVVVSVYQCREPELIALHRLVESVRASNPEALVLLEGPVTMHAKQVLAMAPEIDVLVRGEADDVLASICSLPRTKGTLSLQDAQRLADATGGGIFVRGDRYWLFSRLDIQNVGQHLQMVAPRREMNAVWYTEHGCPHRCAFCRLDTGQTQKGRVIDAEARIDWLIERLLLEIADPTTLSRDDLREALSDSTTSAQTFDAGAGVALRLDSFVGRAKVEITVVSENALASRDHIVPFFESFVALGMQKYFRIKLADVTIVSLTRRKQVDAELIDLLRKAEVFFIGFGTDNLSHALLRDLNKDFYDFDTVVSVNEALTLSGIPSGGIRHNLVLSSPESDLADVKTSLMLLYVAPIYNAVGWMLGSGWGNSRNSKVHGIEGNLYKARDALIYSSFYADPSAAELDGKAFAMRDWYFVASAATEYRLRIDPSPLFYRDERIYALCSDFAWPDFYRGQLIDRLREHFDDEDFKRALETWRNPDEGTQLNALAALIALYQGAFSESAWLDLLRKLKAHMLAGDCFSFVRYLQLCTEDPDLPERFDAAGVSRLVASADRLTRPLHFDALAALTELARARVAASSVLNGDHQGGESVDAQLETITATPLIERMAHPDRQAFEILERLNVFASSNELFGSVSEAMRGTGLHFSAAVEEVVRAQLASEGVNFSHDDYQRLSRTLTEYNAVSVFGSGGWLDRLRDPDTETTAAAVAALAVMLDERRDPQFTLPVVLALRDLARSGRFASAPLKQQVSVDFLAFLVETVPTSLVTFEERRLVFDGDTVEFLAGEMIAVST
jgi:hypothetical protein